MGIWYDAFLKGSFTWYDGWYDNTETWYDKTDRDGYFSGTTVFCGNYRVTKNASLLSRVDEPGSAVFTVGKSASRAFKRPPTLCRYSFTMESYDRLKKDGTMAFW